MGANSIDPIKFEVIKNGFDTLVDQMAITVMRSAHSPTIKDAMDYSTAFCDRLGRVVAQGLNIPLHLGSFPDVLANLLQQYEGNVSEDDIFILNDPYSAGGIHLPDIYIIKPVFVLGELEGFAATVGHHADVGGIVPGSNSTHSREIYQEGLRIPVLKLFERGTVNSAIFSLIEHNVRLPEAVLGDLRAQLGAATIGERGFIDMARRYGSSTLRSYTQEILNYAERVARAEIQDLTDGTYEFTSYIEVDHIDENPVRVHVTLTIDGDEALVDFAGSTNQVDAGINSPLPFSKAAAYVAIRMMFRNPTPNCEGFYRPISVCAPASSILNPTLPAPCGARGITGFRAIDAVLGALAQAAPERVPADGDGGNTNITIGGRDKHGRPFAFADWICGSRGGRPDGDGPEGVVHPGANMTNTPVEIAELGAPVMIEEYEMVPDSGGAGMFRGALAQVRNIRCLADEATLQVRSDKRRYPPFGLSGGKPGTSSLNVLNPGPQEELLPTLAVRSIRRGDVFSHRLAGGGGWGDPLDRDPELVRIDVWNEKISSEYAYREYGVVMHDPPFQVDLERTKRVRQDMKKIRGIKA